MTRALGLHLAWPPESALLELTDDRVSIDELVLAGLPVREPTDVDIVARIDVLDVPPPRLRSYEEVDDDLMVTEELPIPEAYRFPIWDVIELPAPRKWSPDEDTQRTRSLRSGR